MTLEGRTDLPLCPYIPTSSNQTAGQVGVRAPQSVGEQQGAQHAGRMVCPGKRERAGSRGVLDMGFQEPSTQPRRLALILKQEEKEEEDRAAFKG